MKKNPLVHDEKVNYHMAKFSIVICCIAFLAGCMSQNIESRNEKLGLAGLKIGMNVKAVKEKYGDKLKSEISFDGIGFQVEATEKWNHGISFLFREDKLVKIFASKTIRDNTHFQTTLEALKQVLGPHDDEISNPKFKPFFLMRLWGEGKLIQGRVMPEVQAKGEYVLAWFMPSQFKPGNRNENALWLIIEQKD